MPSLLARVANIMAAAPRALRVAGSYRRYLQAHFFDPLGMKQSFTVEDEAHLPNMAQGYHHVNGRLERTLPIHDSVSGSAGNIVSTVDDLQRWSAALACGKVISPASYAAMTTLS